MIVYAMCSAISPSGLHILRGRYHSCSFCSRESLIKHNNDETDERCSVRGDYLHFAHMTTSETFKVTHLQIVLRMSAWEKMRASKRREKITGLISCYFILSLPRKAFVPIAMETTFICKTHIFMYKWFRSPSPKYSRSFALWYSNKIYKVSFPFIILFFSCWNIYGHS